MIGMLRAVTPLLLAALIGIAAYTGMLARQYAAESAIAQKRVEYLTRSLAWKRDQITALEQREMQLLDDQSHIAGRRHELDDNEEIADNTASSTEPSD